MRAEDLRFGTLEARNPPRAEQVSLVWELGQYEQDRSDTRHNEGTWMRNSCPAPVTRPRRVEGIITEDGI